VKLLLPWRLFYRALAKQAPAERQSWLTYFRFGDKYVELIAEVVPLEATNPLDGALSDFERALLSAIGEPNRRRFLH
jgi:hypothetical protein